jgi:hypothetical protein
VFVSDRGSPHIPYARFRAALDAGDLPFILAHADRFTLGLLDAVEVCRLVAVRDPGRLEAASVRWIRRFAAEAVEQQRGDYRLIVDAFDAMAFNPDLAAEQLAALCAARGLER